MGIEMKQFPCFVFFTKIDSGNYLSIGLAGLSEPEMMVLVRQLFDHIDLNKNANALTQLKTFKRVQAPKVTKRALFQNAVEIVNAIIKEAHPTGCATSCTYQMKWL